MGPQDAFETQFHLQEADVVFVEDVVNQFFSERSANRLTFNEIGTVISEQPGDKSTLATAQTIELRNMIVPNTIEVGDRASLGDFDVDALVVTGSLSTAGQVDLYRIEAEAGALLRAYPKSSRCNHNPTRERGNLRELSLAHASG